MPEAVVLAAVGQYGSSLEHACEEQTSSMDCSTWFATLRL